MLIKKYNFDQNSSLKTGKNNRSKLDQNKKMLSEDLSWLKCQKKHFYKVLANNKDHRLNGRLRYEPHKKIILRRSRRMPTLNTKNGKKCNPPKQQSPRDYNSRDTQ